MRNELHHGYTLTSLFIEAKWAKCSRRWTRFGHNGETNGGVYARDARKAYNKAHRKSSRVQLSRYQAPVEEYVSSFTWEQEDDWHWEDLRTDADRWYETKRFNSWEQEHDTSRAIHPLHRRGLHRGIKHFRSWKRLTDVAEREITKMEAELQRRANRRDA